MNLDNLQNFEFPQLEATYTQRDTMLYALGVGACSDPLDPQQLTYVYENKLQTIPSMCNVLAHPSLWIREPALELNMAKLVHAEQRFDLKKPLPAEGQVTGKYHFNGVVDKGPEKGALVYFEKQLYSIDKQQIATVKMTYFFRGDGGCGNWGTPDPELPGTPESAPHGHADYTTSHLAGLIYRLSGDYNPLHADPEVARKAGFEKPILHGLCTYGIACQTLIRTLCDHNTSQLQGMAARFTRPVFPGETIRTEYWNEKDGTAQFRCVALERQEVVLDCGAATLAR